MLASYLAAKMVCFKLVVIFESVDVAVNEATTNLTLGTGTVVAPARAHHRMIAQQKCRLMAGLWEQQEVARLSTSVSRRTLPTVE